MNIKFREVGHRTVQARAIVEIAEDIFINEITILKEDGEIVVELPQKSFKGKNGKIYKMDIITFKDENKKTLWLHNIKIEYEKWRKNNPKVLIYENS
ncbi:MAG: hypothetical protein DRH57_07015 [Candidatus Cloacimonadota bacterium]|nr:MAG: hypothetical protein DRH57_07015 [Candidatus Cloacimonadota bacterium]